MLKRCWSSSTVFKASMAGLRVHDLGPVFFNNSESTTMSIRAESVEYIDQDKSRTKHALLDIDTWVTMNGRCVPMSDIELHHLQCIRVVLLRGDWCYGQRWKLERINNEIRQRTISKQKAQQ